ncbi:MAG TPA: sugar ABC transporter permease [Epulopiscium sp.]|nr:sugar ABC transporter permease [Candidatus Epulonipiscium sp.]
MDINRVKDGLKKNTMLLALIVITIFFAWKTNGTLLAPQNITNLISQNGYVVILAVGMLLCILTGGNIDLSVGSIVALVGALAGKLIVTYKMNIYVAILICLLAGILLGVWQGYWIAYTRIPAFIVTLAGMLLFRGIALMILDGLTISPFPEDFLNLFNSFIPDVFGGTINILAIVVGVAICAIYIAMTFMTRSKRARSGYEMDSTSQMVGKILTVSILIMVLSYSLAKYKGIPSILILLTVIVLGYTYFASKTVPGRHFYAVGGNEKAAKLSGINTDRILMIAYINMAFLSSIVALICVARFNSAAPTAGQNYELDAIGACYVGGASAYGGIGTVAGVVVGAIFMGVLNNGMSIMGIDANIQKAIKGLVLLAAVAFDVISKKRGQTA